MPDITSNSSDKTLKRLSNFTERTFSFRGILCCSLEGILQSLKCDDAEHQIEMCRLAGKHAKNAGQAFVWSRDRFLYWQGEKYKRGTPEYEELIEAIFDAAYAGDPSFADDLLATGHNDLRHTIGETHQYRTVLTRNDFLCNLYRLRARAHREEGARIQKIVFNSF